MVVPYRMCSADFGNFRNGEEAFFLRGRKEDLSASHGNRQGSIAVQQTEYYILYILNRLKIPIISDLKA